MYYVIDGSVKAKIHEATLVLSTGAMFMVPCGEFAHFADAVDTNRALTSGNTY